MPGRKKEPEPTRAWYRARSSGTVRIDGIRHTYVAGRTVLPQDHPLVLRMPQRFAPITLPGQARVTEFAPEPVVAEVPVITETVMETVTETVTEVVVEDEA